MALWSDKRRIEKAAEPDRKGVVTGVIRARDTKNKNVSFRVRGTKTHIEDQAKNYRELGYTSVEVRYT